MLDCHFVSSVASNENLPGKDAENADAANGLLKIDSVINGKNRLKCR